jgi:hypothetical protein
LKSDCRGFKRPQKPVTSLHNIEHFLVDIHKTNVAAIQCLGQTQILNPPWAFPAFHTKSGSIKKFILTSTWKSLYIPHLAINEATGEHLGKPESYSVDNGNVNRRRQGPKSSAGFHATKPQKGDEGIGN